MAIPLACFLCAVLLLLTPSSAEILFQSLRSDDRLVVPLGIFGFSNSGGIDLDISSFSLSNPNADLSKLSFFLTTHPSWIRVAAHLQTSQIDCPLHSDLLRAVFPVSELNPTGASSFSLHSNVTEGRYHVALANCLPGVRVTMEVRSEFFNLFDGRREYLRAGAREVPMVLKSFSFIYLGIMFIWMFLLCFKRSLPTAFHIAVFMFIMCKSMDLLNEADRKSLLNTTGKLFVPPKNFLVAVIVKMPLALLPQAAIVDTSRVDMDRPMLLIPLESLSSLLLGLICFAVVRGIKKLESARTYFVIVFCYTCLTSAVVYSIELATDYKYMWICVATIEFITLGFYVVLYRCEGKPRVCKKTV